MIDQKKAQNSAAKMLHKQYFEDTCVEIQEFINRWDVLTEHHYDAYLRRECSYEEQRIRRVTDIFALYSVHMPKPALEIYDEYLFYFESGWSAYPDIKDALLGLDGYELGIITNGDRSQQIKKLTAAGIDGYFKHIICAGDYPFAKPDKALFQIAIEKSGADKDSFIYVGDNITTDIAPCLEMGVKCVYINRSGDGSADTYVIRDMRELAELVKGL